MLLTYICNEWICHNSQNQEKVTMNLNNTKKKKRMKSEPNKAMDKKNINKMDMVFTEKQF